MTNLSRRALCVGSAATAAPLFGFGRSAISEQIAPSPTLADLITERRRLCDAWTAVAGISDEDGWSRYGQYIDKLEDEITGYQIGNLSEAGEAIDFLLSEADDGLCDLADIRCGGWGADLYRLLLASRNAIGGVS